ncbi:MAG: Flp family type IVb pilin [Armatimonadota bacterium]
MIRRLRDLWSDDSGMTTVEYALLLVLIATVGILAWQTLGQKVATSVDNVNTQLP